MSEKASRRTVKPDDTAQRDADERLAMELEDARAAVERRVADVQRLLDSGNAWRHPLVVTARSRLAFALGEVQQLELLTRPAPDRPRQPMPDFEGLDADIPPLTTRRPR